MSWSEIVVVWDCPRLISPFLLTLSRADQLNFSDILYATRTIYNAVSNYNAIKNKAHHFSLYVAHILQLHGAIFTQIRL